MQYLYEWIISPILIFINYPLNILGFVFTVKDVIILSFMTALICTVLHELLHRNDY